MLSNVNLLTYPYRDADTEHKLKQMLGVSIACPPTYIPLNTELVKLPQSLWVLDKSFQGALHLAVVEQCTTDKQHHHKVNKYRKSDKLSYSQHLC